MNFLKIYEERKQQHAIFSEKINSIMGDNWSICLHTHYQYPTFSIYRDDMEGDLKLSIINNKIIVKENVGVDADTELKIKKTLAKCINEVGVFKMNEHQRQALTDLIELKKIDILESLGHDAIQGDRIIYEMNIALIEGQISKAIIDDDEGALGAIFMKLFMDHNISAINEKAQELQEEAMQEQSDLHGVCESDLMRAHREAGVDARDFF